MENSSRDENARPPDLPPEELYAGQEATVRTSHGTTTGSKVGKEHVKAVYCHLAHLTSMQSTSCEMSDWISTSWNQDFREKYQ